MSIDFYIIAGIVIIFLGDCFLIGPLRDKIRKKKHEEKAEKMAKILNFQPIIKDNERLYTGMFNERKIETSGVGIAVYFKKGYRISAKGAGDFFDYLEKSPETQNIFKTFNDNPNSIGGLCAEGNLDYVDQIGIQYMADKKIAYNVIEIKKKMEMLSQLCNSLEKNLKA